MAVAALKGCDHSRSGEGKQEDPDDDRNLRRFLKHVDKISPSKMDHIEVAIEGHCDEEGDAGSSIEKQHEEHYLTKHSVLTAPQVVLVMMDLERKAAHQQEISNHNIEQEDCFVLPELVSKKEAGHKTFNCFTASEFALYQERMKRNRKKINLSL